MFGATWGSIVSFRGSQNSAAGPEGCDRRFEWVPDNQSLRFLEPLGERRISRSGHHNGLCLLHMRE
jgi:hypothetical protein